MGWGWWLGGQEGVEEAANDVLWVDTAFVRDYTGHRRDRVSQGHFSAIPWATGQGDAVAYRGSQPRESASSARRSRNVQS